MTKDEDMGEQLSAPPDFDGPTARRKHTDVICALMLWAMWISMTGLGVYAVQNGDYRLILYPLDYAGNRESFSFSSSADFFVCVPSQVQSSIAPPFAQIMFLKKPNYRLTNPPPPDESRAPSPHSRDGWCDDAIKVCGTDKGSIDMTDYPYLYYVNEYTGGVCVKKCPNLNGGADPYTLVTYDGLYQVAGSVVTDADISVADYSSTNNTLKCTLDMCYPDGDPEQAYTSAGVNEGKGFASFAVDTYELMWRCVFTDEGSAALNAIINPNGGSNNGTDPIIDMATQNESIKKAYDVWHNLFADLWVTRYYILAFGFGFPLVSKEEIEDKHLFFRFSQMGPLTLHRVCPSFSEKVVGFLYAFMMRIPGVLSMMVWASIFATVGIFFFGGYYAGKTATEWSIAEPKVYTDQEIMIATYSGYAMYAVGGLLVLLFLFMRKRIQMAMGCVKEASKAMLQMPLIIFFPVGNTRNSFMGPAWANLLFRSQAHPLPSRFFPPLCCPSRCCKDWG